MPVKRSYWPIAAGVAVLVLLALAAWLAFRRPAEVDTLQEAKTVAERFLNERDNGNYDAAWNEYTTSFHDRENRNVWQRDLEKRVTSTGGVSQHTFKACKSSETDVYICEYKLVYKDGSEAQNDLWIVKNDKGGWAIDKGTTSGKK
jgi:hypothetical protein